MFELLMKRKVRMKTLIVMACVFTTAVAAFAANPTEGSLSPGSATVLQWDGINCDVFTIHLSGNASDYAGQQLLIKITFSMLSDYDLYVHKDSVNGKVVFPAGNGSQPTT